MAEVASEFDGRSNPADVRPNFAEEDPLHPRRFETGLIVISISTRFSPSSVDAAPVIRISSSHAVFRTRKVFS